MKWNPSLKCLGAWKLVFDIDIDKGQWFWQIISSENFPTIHFLLLSSCYPLPFSYRTKQVPQNIKFSPIINGIIWLNHSYWNQEPTLYGVGFRDLLWSCRSDFRDFCTFSRIWSSVGIPTRICPSDHTLINLIILSRNSLS